MKSKICAMILPVFLSTLLLAGAQSFADGEDLAAAPAEAPVAVIAPTPNQPPMTPEMQAMMAKFAEASTPSEGHKVLEPLIGTWTAAVKFWMEPNATPEESVGTAESRWILEGRFVQQVFNGTSMGKPFQGIGLTGFDNITKQYQTLWIDDMSTSMSIGTNVYDPATKTLSGNSTGSCPMTWAPRNFRNVLKWNEDGSYVYEMYMNDPKTNEEFKGMEIVYTKQA